MKLPRRTFLHLAAVAAALPAASRIAGAQAYPSRPVRLIAPFAPGGATDLVARLMGQWLSERFGQQFIVENRPGAGGNIGTETVVRAPSDGYTLLVAGLNDAVNATLYDKLKFIFLRDIAPVASIVSFPLVMVVPPDVAPGPRGDWNACLYSCDTVYRTRDRHRSNPHKWPSCAGGTCYRVLSACSVAGLGRPPGHWLAPRPGTRK